MEPRFDLRLSLPADERFASMLRDLAAHGAREAGCGADEVSAFGRTVEQAAHQSMAASRGTTIPVTVRCTGGPVEVTIGSCCVSTTR